MLRNKNVLILLCGELIAGLGLWIGIIGNLEFMQVHISSDFMKAVVLFIGLLAGVLVGPFAGKTIDRMSKKKVLIYAGVGRMVSVGFMFLALHYESIMFMVCFMITIQMCAAFYFPALQAIIPLIVADNDLMQMNAFHMNVSTLSRIAGTALAGFMLVMVNLKFLYITSMIAYAIILLLTLSMSFEEETDLKLKDKKSSSFKEILPILKNTPIVISALILTIIPMLFIGGFNLMVINISEIQGDTAVKGLLYTTEGICFFIGTLFVKRLTHLLPPIALMYILTFIISLAHLSLFFSDIKSMSLISLSIFGFGVGCYFPIVATLFQTKISKEYHGRFFSFRNMFDRILFQMVLLMTGILLDTVGLKIMVLIFGGCSLSAVCILAYKYFSKHKMLLLTNKEKHVTK